MYKYVLPAEKALVMIHALTIDGSTLMPAVLMAITHGEELALPELLTKPGSLKGTLRVSRVYMDNDGTVGSLTSCPP